MELQLLDFSLAICRFPPDAPAPETMQNGYFIDRMMPSK